MLQFEKQIGFDVFVKSLDEILDIANANNLLDKKGALSRTDAVLLVTIIQCEIAKASKGKQSFLAFTNKVSGKRSRYYYLLSNTEALIQLMDDLQMRSISKTDVARIIKNKEIIYETHYMDNSLER